MTERMMDDQAQTEDFQLLLDLDPLGQTAAFVPVRWCLSPETFNTLKTRETTEAYMLIMVSSNYGSEENPAWRITQRQVIPLTRELAYVRFNHPGANRIYGLVIWPTAHSDRLKMTKEAHGGSAIYDYTGDVPEYFLRDGDYSDGLRYVATRDVIVPEEMFAPPPKPWMLSLVRKFFRTTEDDQCNFRRNMIVSSLIVGPYVVFTTLVRAIFALFFGVLWGGRDVKWSALWHPMAKEAKDMWGRCDGKRTWWLVDDEHNARPPWFILFQPVSYLVLTLLLWLLGSTKFDWSLKTSFFASIGIHLALVVIAIIVMLIGVSGSALLKNVKLPESKKQKDKRNAEELARKQYAAMLEEMVCTLGNRTPSFQALPAHKRTVWLRFQDTKQKVCRPFAK